MLLWYNSATRKWAIYIFQFCLQAIKIGDTNVRMQFYFKMRVATVLFEMNFCFAIDDYIDKFAVMAIS